jgi:GNAT superfamily N-acetyltransferase
MSQSTNPLGFTIETARERDVPLILAFIRELAEYERLSHEVAATEEGLRSALFGAKPAAEVAIGRFGGEPVGFALFFHDFSTFAGRPGMYLEDLYVRPSVRGRGFGEALLAHVARLACERGCGRMEWAVLDWNEPSIAFYRKLGAVPMSDWTVYRLAGTALAAFAADRGGGHERR